MLPVIHITFKRIVESDGWMTGAEDGGGKVPAGLLLTSNVGA
jgi:hypothetical protein